MLTFNFVWFLIYAVTCRPVLDLALVPWISIRITTTEVVFLNSEPTVFLYSEPGIMSFNQCWSAQLYVKWCRFMLWPNTIWFSVNWSQVIWSSIVIFWSIIVVVTKSGSLRHFPNEFKCIPKRNGENRGVSYTAIATNCSVFVLI